MLISLLLPCCLATDGLVQTRVDLASKNDAMFLTEHGAAQSETTALGTTIASYLKFFQDGGKNPVRFQCSADVDGDQLDELVVLRERISDGKVTLLVVEPPTKLLEKAPKISASYTSGLSADVLQGEIVGLGRIDINWDRKDEILLVRSLADLTRKIEVHSAPTHKKASLGAPLLSISLASVPKDHSILDAFGVDRGYVIPAHLALVQADGSGSTTLSIHELPPSGNFELPAALATISLDTSNSTVESVAPQSDQGHDPGGFVVLRRVDPATQRIDLLRNDGTLSATQSFGTGAIPIRHCDSVQIPTPPPPPPPPPPQPNVARYFIGDSWGGGDVIHIQSQLAATVPLQTSSSSWSFALPGSPTGLLNLTTAGVLSKTTFSITFTSVLLGGDYRADITLPPGPLPQWTTGDGSLRFGYSLYPGQGTVGSLTNLSTGFVTPLEVFYLELAIE